MPGLVAVGAGHAAAAARQHGQLEAEPAEHALPVAERTGGVGPLGAMRKEKVAALLRGAGRLGQLVEALASHSWTSWTLGMPSAPSALYSDR